MRAHLRGTPQSGEPIEADVDLPDGLDIGDSFLLGPERERVQIVGIRTGLEQEGFEQPVVEVAPVAAAD